MIRLRLVCLALLLPAAAAAAAGDTTHAGMKEGPEQKAAAACRADLERLCKDVEPGESRVSCMKAHKDELSPECRAMMGGKAGRKAKKKKPAVPAPPAAP
jgi:hypothetical protein